MANAVAEKKKIEEDEFGIHGDLATSGANGDDFVVLYDSSQEGETAEPPAPSLDDLNESHTLGSDGERHAEDAYIDDILSSDDIETPAPVKAAATHGAAASDLDDDGPISLSSEELDGILEMGPGAEEEFHPDFPPDGEAAHEPMQHDAPAPVLTSEEPEEFELPPAELNEMESGSASADGYDDDELPIAISDEDLDEILLEEEGADFSQGAPAAAPAQRAPDFHEEQHVSAAPTPAEDHFDSMQDEEPIALSDDELDHILADAEAGHDGHDTTPAPGIEDEILTLDDDSEITLIDDSGPADSLDAGFDNNVDHSEPQHDRGAPDSAGASFFDSDEDEPITLSDEELDGILSSAPEESHKNTDEVLLGELPNDGTVEIQDDHSASASNDDDEPVSLSNEELDGILMDTDEPIDGLADLPPEHDASPSADAHKDFFDADEDEPIALSADELDGIAATAVEEDAPAAPAAPLAELPPDEMGDLAGGDAAALPEIDERYNDVDHMDASTEPGSAEADEDDGPIALSADELDGIAADAHEVTPEAPMVPLGPLDGGHEPSLAENTDKQATVFEEDLEAATLIHEDDKAAAAPTPDTEELKSVMGYLDNLLGELPDDVIEKFAQSEYFKLYQKIMDKLGI